MIYYKAQIYCMCILAILFIMCVVGVKQKTRENMLYKLLLVFAMFNMVFDVASNYTVNHLDDVSPLTNRVVHIGFYISVLTLFTVLHQYLSALIEKELGRQLRRRYYSYIPYIIACVLIVFLPIQYMVEETGNWSYGPGLVTLYVCVAIYVLLTIALLLKYNGQISKKNRLAIILALCGSLGASLFQMVYPAALTSSLGVVVLCLSIYMTVANPDAVLVGMLKEETARADAANRAKSDFLAKMSHEIRTPINAVIGMNEMVLRQTQEADTKKCAGDIKNSAYSLLSIINDILDASKIESGKMEILPANYDMGSLLNDLYNMTSVKAHDKELNLVFDVDSTIPSGYYGDDIRVKQVLMNLLSNAVKYTMQGTITFTVTGRRVGDDEVLHFSVKDTGIGIKEEDLGRLFAKFERIEEQRNRNVEGTGLGINIAQQLLRLMDSELKVESVYGQGSEFYFDLSQKIVEEEPLGNFRERIEKSTMEYNYKAGYNASRVRALVVDDNMTNIKVFKGLVKPTGMQVEDALSGEACIELLESGREFDIIFLDHMMPGMDGMDTLRVIKERTLVKDTPIIILTANAVTGAREQYMEAGFDDFVTKPIIPDKLDDVIVRHLEDKLLPGEEPVRTEKCADIDELPQLEEFDFEYAMRILMKKDLLMETLADFGKTLKTLPDKLDAYVANLNDEEMLTSYRIEVHALKSMAATVGALLLSKVARLLEVAAIDGEVDKIRLVHPVLVEEMNKHRMRITTLFPEQDKLPIEDMGVIRAYLDMLKMSLLNDDYMTSDFVSSELAKYEYPDTFAADMEMLADKVLNMEAAPAVAIIDEIKIKMGE